MRVVFLSLIVGMALMTPPTPSKPPVLSGPCPALDPETAPALLVVSPIKMIDLEEGILRIGTLSFLMPPGQRTIHEYHQYFRSLPLGLQSTLAIRLERIPPELAELTSSPPEINGTLEEAVEEELDGFYKLRFGGKKPRKELLLAPDKKDECLQSALTQFLGPVKLVVTVPTGT